MHFLFSAQQLAQHFRDLGYPARELERDEPGQPRRRIFGSVFAWVALEGCGFDLVGVYHGGTLPLSLDNMSTSIGRRIRVPLRKVHPIQIHFIVKQNPLPFPPHYEAALSKDRRSWKGGGLARRLARDEPLTARLATALADFERVDIKPEPDDQLVRLRLETRTVGGLLTVIPDAMKRETGLPSVDLFDALRDIATHIRSSRAG